MATTLLSSGIVRMTATTARTFVLKNASFRAKGGFGGASSLFHHHRQRMDKRRTPLKAVTNSNSFSSSSSSTTNKAKKKATTTSDVEKRQRMTHMAKVRASFSPSSSTEEKMFTVQHNLESLSDKIFCNRSLPMKSIRSVGFDMDYTLACLLYTSPSPRDRG